MSKDIAATVSAIDGGIGPAAPLKQTVFDEDCAGCPKTHRLFPGRRAFRRAAIVGDDDALAVRLEECTMIDHTIGLAGDRDTASGDVIELDVIHAKALARAIDRDRGKRIVVPGALADDGQACDSHTFAKHTVYAQWNFVPIQARAIGDDGLIDARALQGDGFIVDEDRRCLRGQDVPRTVSGRDQHKVTIVSSIDRRLHILL